MYADDIVLLSETPEGLQNSIQILSNFCSLWKLEINETKSKILIFESRKQNCDMSFKIDNKELERVYEYKYLGIVIR